MAYCSDDDFVDTKESLKGNEKRKFLFDTKESLKRNEKRTFWFDNIDHELCGNPTDVEEENSKIPSEIPSAIVTDSQEEEDLLFKYNPSTTKLGIRSAKSKASKKSQSKSKSKAAKKTQPKSKLSLESKSKSILNDDVNKLNVESKVKSVSNGVDKVCPPLGLRNMGNVCWFNSVVQVLCTLPEFINRILMSSPPPDVPLAFIKALFQKIKSNKQNINTYDYVKKLRLTNYDLGKQHDANACLIDILNTCYPDKSNDCMFKVTMSESMTCDKPECKHKGKEISKEEEEFHYILPLHVNDGNSIQAILNKLMDPVKVIRNCDGCDNTEASKASYLLSIGDVVIMQLKIFGYNKIKNKSEKLTPTLHIEQEINLFDTLDLQGVIYHRGPNLEEGHYISSVKQNNKCFFVDDKHVTSQSTWSSPLGSADVAYILVYKKRSNLSLITVPNKVCDVNDLNVRNADGLNETTAVESIVQLTVPHDDNGKGSDITATKVDIINDNTSVNQLTMQNYIDDLELPFRDDDVDVDVADVVDDVDLDDLDDDVDPIPPEDEDDKTKTNNDYHEINDILGANNSDVIDVIKLINKEETKNENNYIPIGSSTSSCSSDGGSVDSGGYIKKFSGYKEANEAIDNFATETGTSYCVTKTSKSDDFVSNLNEISGNGYMIRWEDRAHKTGRDALKFDGIPFIITGKRMLTCANGIDHNKSKKSKLKEEKISVPTHAHDHDHDHPALGKKRRIRMQDTKKMGCDAIIAFRKIIFFPDLKVTKDTKTLKQNASKNLRAALAEKGYDGMNYRTIWVVTFPSSNCHKGHFVGEQGDYSQIVDKRIIAKIKEYVKEGILSVHEMRRIINLYVKNDLFLDKVKPRFTSRQFYPTDTDIYNHMYNAMMKLRLSKIDQENVELLVRKWEEDRPDDKFYFRGCGQKSNENIAQKSDLEQRLIFVHQSMNQKRLMQLYGN